jgi:ornithine cyclodeaminase
LITGAVLLFEGKHGQLLSVIDATEITGVRTAAASALATEYMANANTDKLCILGSGHQAKSHIEAITTVRKFSKVW